MFKHDNNKLTTFIYQYVAVTNLIYRELCLLIYIFNEHIIIGRSENFNKNSLLTIYNRKHVKSQILYAHSHEVICFEIQMFYSQCFWINLDTCKTIRKDIISAAQSNQ